MCHVWQPKTPVEWAMALEPSLKKMESTADPWILFFHIDAFRWFHAEKRAPPSEEFLKNFYQRCMAELSHMQLQAQSGEIAGGGPLRNRLDALLRRNTELYTQLRDELGFQNAE